MVDEEKEVPYFTNLEELEKMVEPYMSKVAFTYYSSGSDDEISLLESKKAWKEIRVVPRVLVDVSTVSTSCKLLGHDLPIPILIAPMAMQRLAHPHGELAVARAAGRKGIPMVVSTMATHSTREVASVQPRPLLFFQLYVLKNHSFVHDLVRKVEADGYTALVLTVDAPVAGNREGDEKNRFHLPKGLELKNLEGLEMASSPHQQRSDQHQSQLVTLFYERVDASLTWDIIPWLKSLTNMPVLVKGILSPSDAEIAVNLGVDGIICSNHGGRQLDTCVSTATALPKIVSAVDGRVPVLVDGGIHRGTDVLKALALGASGILVGRSILYGLALGGQKGVEAVLDKLTEELRRAMILSGCPSIKDITSSLILGRDASMRSRM